MKKRKITEREKACLEITCQKRFEKFVESVSSGPRYMTAREKRNASFQRVMNRKLMKAGRPVCYANGIINPVKLNIATDTLNKIKKEK